MAHLLVGTIKWWKSLPPTPRFVIPVVALFSLLWLGNIGWSYYRLRSAHYPPLSPSRFTVLGFPKKEAEARHWTILMLNEVPQVVEMLHKGDFGRPDYGMEDKDFRKRIDIADVLKDKAFPVVLTEKHVAKAWYVKRESITETLRSSPYLYTVHLRLTEEGKGRLWHYAKQHVDEQILIIVNDADGLQPWAAPRITSEIASQWWLLTRFSPFESSDVQIDKILDEEIAQKIVEGVQSK